MKKNWRSRRPAGNSQRMTAGWYFCMMILFVLISCSKNKNIAIHDQYTCSMHPQIIRDEPGKCPICGMELVRILKPGEASTAIADLSLLVESPAKSVVSEIRAILPIEKVMDIRSEAKGVITHDTRKVATLSARYSGRIEKLYVHYNFQEVRKGQKILEIYSPELITAQRELLYVIDKDANNTQQVEASKQKLALLGLSDAQIRELISSKKESSSFAVYSPLNGYIMDHAEDSDMKNEEIASSALRAREGMYVTTGEAMFSVVSHVDLWAEFELYQGDVAHVKVKDPVMITVDNEDEVKMQSEISFVQPFIKEGNGFVKIRVYLSNEHRHFHAGQFVTATFIRQKKSLWIPREAKIDMGTQTAAFVKHAGVYQPVAISVGEKSENWIEIVKGLHRTDSIAYNAQFMIDSESFIHLNQNEQL